MFADQRVALEQLLADSERLHHGLIVEGAPGIGKAAFANAIAAALLCETPIAERSAAPSACGRCPSCGWLDAGRHPDLRRIHRLEKEGKLAAELSIDQIRNLDEFVALSSFRGGPRVILVDPADALNSPAASALLKVLEEPGPRTFFLLVTQCPERLLATVRSRCRRVRVPAPSATEAAQWLNQSTGVAPADAVRLLGYAGGAPLHARDLADPAHLTAYRTLLEAIESLPDTTNDVVADRIGTMSATRWYPILQRWMGDLVRVAAGATPRFFPESTARLTQLGKLSSLPALTGAAIGLQRQSNLVRHPLNPRLFLEESLALYRDAFGGPRDG